MGTESSETANAADVTRPPSWASALLDQSREAVAAFSSSGEVLYCNPATEELLGWPRGSGVGTSVFEMVHPDDLTRVLVSLDGLGQGARPLPGMISLRRADGEHMQVEVSPSSIDLPPPPEGPGPLTLVTIRETSLPDAHWSFLAALSSGEDLHRCFGILAEGLSTATDGPMGISYGDRRGRRVAGPLGPDMAGIDAHGGLDTSPASPWSEAIRTGGPVTVMAEDLNEPLRTEALRRGHAACVVVPVSDPSGGAPALIVQWPPDAALAHLLTEALARRPQQAVSLALDRRDAHRRLERMAHNDSLTGLVNRRRFFSALGRLRSDTRSYGVLYVDLDRFKAINDTLGHVIGDHTLVVCGRRLERLAGANATVSRLGGDEFAIAFPGISEADLQQKAADVVDALSQPFRIAEHLIVAGASVGMARTEGDDEPDAVVAAADAALYEAKRSGRGAWRKAEEIVPTPDSVALDPMSVASFASGGTGT